MKVSVRVVGLALISAALVAACGGSGGGGGGSSASGSTSLSGVFADSPVGGLTYVIGGVAAKTDATGHFTYKAGDSITFKVGDIVLGTATGKPFLSPVSLVPGATDETNDTVTNIAKFLQTIDDNNNPADGIQLTTVIHTAATGQPVNFAQTPANYDASMTGAYFAITSATASSAHAGVTDVNAKNHLRSTLFAAMAGTYSGSYSGSGTGTFSFTTDSTGAITSGQILQSPSNTPILLAGNISSAGFFSSNTAGTLSNGTPVTLVFTGNVDVATSTVSGTWSVTNAGAGINFTGSFSGKK